MRRNTVLSAFAGFFLLISSAFAQDFRSEVSLQGTANIPQNRDNLDLPYEATKSAGLLLGYRFHLNRWFAVEGDYGYTRNTHKFFNPFAGETPISANVHQLTAEAVITAPSSSRVRPYGLAGFGGIFLRPINQPNADFFGVGSNQTRPAFVYGGGVDFDLTRFMALRAEYRGYVFKIPDFQVPGLATDNFTHMAEPSIGFVWRF
jgi:opacity protein-like surface antigen